MERITVSVFLKNLGGELKVSGADGMKISRKSLRGKGLREWPPVFEGELQVSGAGHLGHQKRT